MNCGIKFQENPRTGIHAVIPVLKVGMSSQLRKLKSNSFNYVANVLPNAMRRMYAENKPFETFKQDLDTILSTVPDQPTIAGLSGVAKSNSLIHQMPSYIV